MSGRRASAIGAEDLAALGFWCQSCGDRRPIAALVADGLHARTDGFTSLAVLLGAGGAALGWRQADPHAALAHHHRVTPAQPAR